MSRMYRHMLATIAMLAMASDPTIRNDIYSTPRHKEPRFKKPETGDELLSEPRTFQDSRQLREFSIKGHKVMAYSKKDAITRLKHMKKL